MLELEKTISALVRKAILAHILTNVLVSKVMAWFFDSTETVSFPLIPNCSDYPYYKDTETPKIALKLFLRLVRCCNMHRWVPKSQGSHCDQLGMYPVAGRAAVDIVWITKASSLKWLLNL
jgi:hypothetical protein